MRNITGTTFGQNWRVGKKITSSGEATIYIAKPPSSKKKYILKVIREYNSMTLRKEKRVYTRINPNNNLRGFPKTYNLTYSRTYTGMVIERLGSTLEYARRYLHEKFPSDHTMLAIAIQCVNAVRRVHDTGYLHRDIKPENFMLGQGCRRRSIHLIDFGMAKRYLNDKGAHSEESGDATFRGTPYYASANALRGQRVSRRDDMISLGYTFAFMWDGHLPWPSRECEMHTQRKTGAHSDELCKGAPKAFKQYFAHVEALSFSERPNYEAITKSLEKGLCVRNLFHDWKLPAGAFKTKLGTRCRCCYSQSSSSES